MMKFVVFGIVLCAYVVNVSGALAIPTNPAVLTLYVGQEITIGSVATTGNLVCWATGAGAAPTNAACNGSTALTGISLTGVTAFKVPKEPKNFVAIDTAAKANTHCIKITGTNDIKFTYQGGWNYLSYIECKDDGAQLGTPANMMQLHATPDKVTGYTSSNADFKGTGAAGDGKPLLDNIKVGDIITVYGKNDDIVCVFASKYTTALDITSTTQAPPSSGHVTSLNLDGKEITAALVAGTDTATSEAWNARCAKIANGVATITVNANFSHFYLQRRTAAGSGTPGAVVATGSDYSPTGLSLRVVDGKSKFKLDGTDSFVLTGFSKESSTVANSGDRTLVCLNAKAGTDATDASCPSGAHAAITATSADLSGNDITQTNPVDTKNCFLVDKNTGSVTFNLKKTSTMTHFKFQECKFTVGTSNNATTYTYASGPNSLKTFKFAWQIDQVANLSKKGDSVIVTGATNGNTICYISDMTNTFSTTAACLASGATDISTTNVELATTAKKTAAAAQCNKVANGRATFKFNGGPTHVRFSECSIKGAAASNNNNVNLDLNVKPMNVDDAGPFAAIDSTFVISEIQADHGLCYTSSDTWASPNDPTCPGPFTKVGPLALVTAANSTADKDSHCVKAANGNVTFTYKGTLRTIKFIQCKFDGTLLTGFPIFEYRRYDIGGGPGTNVLDGGEFSISAYKDNSVCYTSGTAMPADPSCLAASATVNGPAGAGVAFELDKLPVNAAANKCIKVTDANNTLKLKWSATGGKYLKFIQCKDDGTSLNVTPFTTQNQPSTQVLNYEVYQTNKRLLKAVNSAVNFNLDSLEARVCYHITDKKYATATNDCSVVAGTSSDINNPVATTGTAAPTAVCSPAGAATGSTSKYIALTYKASQKMMSWRSCAKTGTTHGPIHKTMFYNNYDETLAIAKGTETTIAFDQPNIKMCWTSSTGTAAPAAVDCTGTMTTSATIGNTTGRKCSATSSSAGSLYETGAFAVKFTWAAGDHDKLKVIFCDGSQPAKVDGDSYAAVSVTLQAVTTASSASLVPSVLAVALAAFISLLM